MTAKKRDIIDTLLCALYMAVFCVPTIYLTIGIIKYFDWNGALTLVCPIVCGVFSVTAIFSVSKKKAGIKWAVSVPFSVCLFLATDNISILRIYKTIAPVNYSGHDMLPMGDAFVGMGVIGVLLFAVLIGNVVGICCSGMKLKQKTEHVFAVFQKIVCPILCTVIVCAGIIYEYING